ncbi:hypothetical protein HBI20_250650 [Parastagonospora nodorum]|nr:hypothetical protein HBI20_250650 [Parastagonospora nodorum]
MDSDEIVLVVHISLSDQRDFAEYKPQQFTHSTPANQKMTFKSEGAIESDESAIESDEGAIEQDDSVWEDDDNEESSGPASPKEDCSFQCLKIEVKPPVDRSLLTKDFQKTMQNEASPTRSPSVDRRSRTTRPNDHLEQLHLSNVVVHYTKCNDSK